ncbi:redox-regulated ATPase YchF [Halocatena pleomorpha]|uniref:Redox-regulated ATPase YchF n=1 Tax=Halocatena pleomorpha TaxID=1785090 RepID=A0A3P3RGE4_9EURY|nr:redox-regulated ATPase YchF [Halocatena pleomorpha]RRJ32491.1 redox-regulated ATPase YchF [Halocatena pleomorpha]
MTAGSLSLALAGKPNAGKSTFFRAATLADVEIGNYPFTTIDANRGVTHVRTDCPCLDRDERCDSENCHDGIRFVPVELLDVAGLVPGAHEGRGLGNQFLDALSNADAVLNVVDASGGTNAEGEPVEVGAYDPVQDVDFVREEMDLWLAGIVDRNWETVERQSRSPDFDLEDALTELLTGFGASEPSVAATLRSVAYPDDPRSWTDEDRERLARELRARTKPILVVGNKADVADTDTIDQLRNAASDVVPTTAEGELALRQASDAGAIEYEPGDPEFTIVEELTAEQDEGLERIQSVMHEWDGTGVQSALDTAVYDRLDYITVYPVQNETNWTDGQGTVLPDAVLLPHGATPTDLAYAVHSDIGDGYLHAVDARDGRRVSDDHELTEGDVIKVVSTT